MSEAKAYEMISSPKMLEIMTLYAMDMGFIDSNEISTVPDVNVVTRNAVITVHNGLIEYFQKENMAMNPVIFGSWCAYAGMAAAAAWRKDNDVFTKKTMQELLMGGGGIDTMDEHVIKMTGLEAERTNEIMGNTAAEGYRGFYDKMSIMTSEDQLTQMFEFEMACYAFGVSYMLNAED